MNHSCLRTGQEYYAAQDLRIREFTFFVLIVNKKNNNEKKNILAVSALLFVSFGDG